MPSIVPSGHPIFGRVGTNAVFGAYGKNKNTTLINIINVASLMNKVLNNDILNYTFHAFSNLVHILAKFLYANRELRTITIFFTRISCKNDIYYCRILEIFITLFY